SIFITFLCIFKTSINNNESLSSVIYPFPYVSAIHEILQSYKDIIPVYNKRQDSEYKSFQNITIRKKNHLHHVTPEKFVDDEVDRGLSHKKYSVSVLFLT